MERHKVVSAVYLVLERGDELLLLKRKNTGYYDGKYSFVAGHLDGNESCTRAVIREAWEEAGIHVAADKLKVVHVANRKSQDGERIDVFFKALEWDGEIRNMEPDKCEELVWYSKNALPENTIPFIRGVVEMIDDGVFYSEFGW